jgi:hypothetical protein
MRLAALALLTTLALVPPAFADATSDLAAAKATIAAAKLSTASDLDMWCGAAFTLAATHFTSAGNTTDADSSTKSASVMFGKAAPLLTADGVADADLGNISTQYMVVVNAQLNDQSEPAEHTKDECDAAAAAQ